MIDYWKWKTQNAETAGTEIDFDFLPLPTWKKMLQQLVIQEEPLEWLSKAIDNKANLENIGKGVVEGTRDTSAIREMLKKAIQPIKKLFLNFFVYSKNGNKLLRNQNREQ